MGLGCSEDCEDLESGGTRLIFDQSCFPACPVPRMMDLACLHCQETSTSIQETRVSIGLILIEKE